ncbi:hypothetical protein AB9N12_14450 [Bacteroides sp. AN502(2024)]|uniref:hypothetical protein n=1 Tax=Bacteroides sp. AN502(2024) TaxID=3160599 RepID=UPI003518E3FF
MIRESSSKVSLSLEWQKDNAIKVGDDSFVYDEDKKVKGIDIAKCFSYLMSNDVNREIFYAELLGLSGEKSVNLLKSFVDGAEQEHLLKCTQDDQGYLTSVSMEGADDMSVMPTTITITYE